MTRLLGCAALLILLVNHVQAQTTFSGVVTDIQDEPIPGAIVSIANSPGAKDLYITETDSLGAYRIHNCPDTFTLSVSAFGYAPHTSPVSFSGNTTTPVHTKLKWTDVGEVIVKGTAKPRMMRNGEKLVIDKIENSPYAKANSAFTFLRYVPVLQVKPSDGTVEVAGGTKASLQIDGRRTNIPLDAMLKSIAAENIERIEIIAIPGSEYGGKGSIINVVMKRRPDQGMQYSFNVGDTYDAINSMNGSFNLRYSGKKTFITSGIYLRNERYLRENKDEYRFYDSGRQTQIRDKKTSKLQSLSPYFNLDHELDKKNTIGVRLSGLVNFNNTINTAISDFGELSALSFDSTYMSEYKTTTPNKLTDVSANINYTRKTDTKGSVLMADVDYIFRTPNEKTHNIFDKITEAQTLRESDFIQREKTKVNALGAWVRYNHVFNPDTKLNSGISLSGGKTRYNFDVSNFDGNDYISDPTQANLFDYDDMTLSVYTSFQRNWSKKLTTVIGLRLENYNADGLQKTSGEKMSRHETNLKPSLTVNYRPHEKHSLSLNATRSIGRPGYYQLNPFKTYLSPTIYSVGNPDLKTSYDWTGRLSYDFFDDYSFIVSTSYTENNSQTLNLPDGNGMIMIKEVNYGNAWFTNFRLNASKTLFDGYWYLSGGIRASYKTFKGMAESVNLNVSNWSYAFSVDSDVTFSKKHKISGYVSYSYRTSTKGVIVTYENSQDIDISLNKRFKNSSLSVGVYRDLVPDLKQTHESPEYGFTMLLKNYWSWRASYSITFGNQKARSVDNRSNSDISGRMK